MRARQAERIYPLIKGKRQFAPYLSGGLFLCPLPLALAAAWFFRFGKGFFNPKAISASSREAGQPRGCTFQTSFCEFLSLNFKWAIK